MRGRPVRALAIALPTAVVIAACGSGGSGGGASPAAAVKTYLTAVASGDGATACRMLAPDLERRALSTAHAQGNHASDCPSLFSQVKNALSPTQRSAFLNAQVSGVRQTGTTATVTISGAVTQPTLEQTGSRWFITGGIGF